MSEKESRLVTMTSTMTASLASSSPMMGSEPIGSEDEDDPVTLTGSGDMDLVNGPNPWLPAYGFQLQHHAHFQPTHEDLRANDTVLVQQVDFLETIVEETSDDLQSDSDRSGTTYWVGSDSETESVIHIRAKQRAAEERLDGSGSECNSVVPKKRRRRNNGTSDRDHGLYEDYPSSPRSSRSTASSRSSSLLQFESLERTCATLSPSSYSFDSLEYSNRSNASHPENTSPDSLEQDYERLLPNGFPVNNTTAEHFPRIRPYRSFESLDTCQKEDSFGQLAPLANGFAPLYLKGTSDLSRTGRNDHRSRHALSMRNRGYWRDEEEYEDDEEDDEDEEDEEDDENLGLESRLLSESRADTSFEDRRMIFGDQSCNYATSLDYRNTIDLREIGIETKHDTLLDLKSGQATVSSSLRLLQARLNIAGGATHDHHHHHHHHHHQPQHGYERLDSRQHQQHPRQGWSKEECFNFRFTDKSQSAPSLPSTVEQSAHSPHSSSRTTSFVSTSNLFENYTRVASVPVDLNLCGVSEDQDDPRYRELSAADHEMAEVTGLREQNLIEEQRLQNGEEERSIMSQKSLTSSVRTQGAHGLLIDGTTDIKDIDAEDEEECVDGHCEKPQQKKQVTSTVKTQDRNNGVLDMAMAMEKNTDIDTVVDEAIKQFKREVQEATGNNIEGIQRTLSGKQRPRRVKNNASYELAQQYEVDERNFRPNRLRTRRELAKDGEKSAGESTRESPRTASTGRRRVLNNASYELAQQCDYIKALQSSRGAFQRMDACDELEEPVSGRSSRLRISEMVQQLNGGSASNLSSPTAYEPGLQSRRYSKSTENVSNPFPEGYFTQLALGNPRPKKEEDNSLFGQIKKNSDPFSIYGESANTRPLVDDEIDYPCLETKPIGASSQEGHISHEETNPQEHYDSFHLFESLLQEATYKSTSPQITKKSYESPSFERKPTDVESLQMSFIGEYYPEKTVRLQQQQHYQLAEEFLERCRAEEAELRRRAEQESPEGTRSAGERLWRVVVEKETQQQEKERLYEAEEETTSRKDPGRDQEEEEAEESKKELDKSKSPKNEEVEEKEEATTVAVTVAATVAAAEAARGQSVHSVRSSPPSSSSTSSGGRGNSGRLEPSERSGNPAVAVAVDTNHRGDRDKRHEENAPVTTARWTVDDESTMSSTTQPKRGFVVGSSSSTITSSSSSSSRKDSPAKFPVPNLASANATGNLTAPAKEERKKSGLGGFLQRFSRLRFSGRSKVPRSEVQKKSDTLAQVNRAKLEDQERKKKEPDYIIIPLHPPEEERRKNEQLEDRPGDSFRNYVDDQRSPSNINSNGRAPVSSKPPLPPQPPRYGALSSRACAGAGGGGVIGGGGTSLTASASASVSSARRRATTDLGNPAAIEMAKARTMQAAQERPVGLLETDLDEAVTITTTTTNIIVTNGQPGKKTRSLLNLNHTATGTAAAAAHPISGPRARPENALHVPQSPVSKSHRSNRDDDHTSTINQRPHKSMEFLLDKENLHFVKPPENELQKVGERTPSEHELRVQRSLQRLNVPDWYKNSPAARDGFRLKRHSDASQHGGWRALGSKTTSLSSLSSSSNRQPTAGALLSPSPTPPVFSRWSTSLLNSAGSSTASSARSSFNHRQPYLGWRSQERLTNPRTPAERLAQGILPQLQAANKQQQQQQQTTNQQLEVRNSIKEVTSAIVHYVQSGQEVGGGERLSPRPRTEDTDDRGGTKSTSPKGKVKLYWIESSFVGTRRVESPETPMSAATETECCAGCNTIEGGSCTCIDTGNSGLFLDLTPTRDDHQHSPSSSSSNYHHHHHHRQLHQQQQQQQQRHHRGSGQSDTDEAMATAALLRNKPSPGSTTLEDVLDSLLGLPSASRTPSPGPGPVVTGTSSSSMRHRANVGQASAKAGKSCSDLRQDLQESARSAMDVQGATDGRASYYVGELVRRKSEGSDTMPSRSTVMQSRIGGPLRPRRVSFDSTQDANGLAEKIIKCRNNKCTNSATLAEARKTYKSCHNCTCLYCSRECRRAHWQRHRKTCLHSRAGSLCRQVLSSAKEDTATLKHISMIAKRGHAAHGRGAVKCFFTSPEAAEKFIGNGFTDLGEPIYVRSSDLLPGEMGTELYTELIKLCKSYNPDSKLVLYVAVCVVSEVPTSGAVKWERQLVSRCAKIHLDSANRHHASSSTSPRGRQQSTSPCNITREMDSPEMLVLTSQPGNNGQITPKKIREISFSNIQRQLKLRGVSLRRHFPQVYKKLRAYVDGTVDKFAPVTIYPRDQASGKSFMCIIMLDVEPDRLQLLPTDSSRVKTVDISVEEE